VQSCQGCDLYQGATQGVMGEGPVRARLMLVGEQPGDREDREGHPFVGPAGRLLGRALSAAGLARDRVFLTNAVKHFKWRPGGARVTRKRGRIFPSEWAKVSSMTVHPSSLLRIPDSGERKRGFDAFVRDLRAVREALAALPAPSR
jgi:DNA polymerase